VPVFNHGEMYRDFTYIDDIIAGTIAALDHPPTDDRSKKAGGSIAPHALYNIGNHRSEHLMTVVGLLEQACGRTAQIEFLPMQSGDVHKTYADISAISRDLGYAPTTAITDGVPSFVRWFRDYHRV
jgi:UDP-glucuronate 4-epimerase